MTETAALPPTPEPQLTSVAAGPQGVVAPEEHRLLAAALEGEARALARVAGELDPTKVCAVHRLGPALAMRARRAGLGGEAAREWSDALRQTTAHALLLTAALQRVGRILGKAEVRWCPLKGTDLADRVYDDPADRPSIDVDLLIPADAYPAVRPALEKDGWMSIFEGERVERYLREEGYCWQAVHPDGVLLELHLRLWGLLPQGFEAELLEQSHQDPDLPPGGRRLSLAHAYVVAGVHAWLNPRPRPLLGCWDLGRIGLAGEPTLAQEVIAITRRWDVQLPVALAAAYAFALWQEETNGAVATALLQELRPPERRVARRALAEGAYGLSLPALVLARLLSGRASRNRWRVLPRQIWAHPGVVEQETPRNWPWKARRLFHVLRRLHLRRPAMWVRGYCGRRYEPLGQD